ncbi:MAG: GNAT family N-acetyltransferase [Spirochaetota bacterium]
MICENFFEQLNKTRHDRASFDCGENELNEFLWTKALRHMKTGVSRTMVLPTIDPREDGKRAICAFYAIAPSAVDRETFSEQESKRLPKYPIPVFLIGQLAVDRKKRGEGLGRITLIKALEHLWNVNTYMRAYAVVVDCLTETAKAFYEKYGFMSFGQFRGHERMFLPMKTVGRLFET